MCGIHARFLIQYGRLLITHSFTNSTKVNDCSTKILVIKGLRLCQPFSIKSNTQNLDKGLTVWQYRLWSFKLGYTKLARFLPKNQHTQRKLLNFENWCNGEVSKSAKI